MLKLRVLHAAALSAAMILPAVTLCAQKDTANPHLSVRGNNEETAAPTATDVKSVPEAQKYVTREFGPGFVIAKDMPMLVGDVDGDGLEDAVFVVTGGSPMLSAGAFNYKVIDPYDGFWSFADPALNTHVPMVDPGPHYYLLLAHDWKGEHPKAKYLIFNLPFKQISLIPTAMPAGKFGKKGKKVIVAAIATVESDGQQGAVIWNGKEYRFTQLGNTEE